MTTAKTTTPASLGTVRTLPTSAIRPSANNPRKVPQAAIDIVAESIKEFGWQQPLVVDIDNVLIVGHTRLKAAQKLGLATVPVVIAENLTPQQVRAYRIADNRSGDFTSWDFPELAKQLDELAEDFSEVLALANWQAVIADYDAMVAGSDKKTAADADGSVDAWDKQWDDGDDSDEITNYLTADFKLLVVLDSEESARKIAVALMDMPGVLDVRDKR